MKYYELLKDKLVALGYLGNGDLISSTVEIENPNILQLRDNLLRIGEIIEEDLSTGLYISSIKTGPSDFSRAYVASIIVGKRIYFVCSSKEGLIKQRHSQKAMRRLLTCYPSLVIEAGKSNGNKRNKSLLLLIISLVLVSGIVISSGIYLKQFHKETQKYNEIVSLYNKAANEYNRLLPLTSVENIMGFYDSLPTLPNVDDEFHSMLNSLLHGNTLRKIASDISTVQALTENINRDIDIVEQITAPEASWVLSRVEHLDGITDAAMVSESNDPNQMLNKEGGYSGCIYFSLSSIQNAVGADAIEKGTDGGGAIEIYQTLEDAQKRCEYLSQYDGTLLYSGSYAIIGTMVIRVSYELDANEQFKVTSSITYLLTQ